MIRKKWTKEEIQEVIKMKKSGIKLLTIGLKFNKTANAIRKLLLRRYPLYIQQKIKSSEEINLSLASSMDYSTACNWVKGFSVAKKCPVAISEEHTTVENIISINNYRKLNGYPVCNIRNCL